MIIDPLSDIVAASGARCGTTRCMEIDGDWHFEFAAPAGIKFIAVTRGCCWLTVADNGTRRLETGDAFMLRGDHAFELATDLGLPAINGNGVFTAPAPSDDVRATAFQAICGHVAIERDRGMLLIEALPPLIVIDRASPEAPGTAWMLHQLVRELNGERPGHVLALEHFTQLIFVEMIRSYAADHGSSSIGWIAALGDDRLAGALRLMHGQPAKNWTVGELAARAGLSRTSFATRFSAAMGIGPTTYLGNWRMQLAERELCTTPHSISWIARAVGFASASAFGAAFRARYGLGPREYRSTRVSDHARASTIIPD